MKDLVLVKKSQVRSLEGPTCQKARQRVKVALALSGGVDSSVALALLKNEEYDVTAIFMENWTNNSFKKYGYGASYTGCTTDQDKADAIKVASHLGVPFKVWNFEKEYQDRVMKYFFKEYKAGRTPNPDVMCNREIKFGIFFDRALKEGFDYVATGHYARVKYDQSLEKFKLLAALDPSKDQSYFLCTLGQKQLAHILFPIGGFKKVEIRKIALRYGLPTARKKDSQGICFIGKVSVADFLRTFIKGHIGNVVTTSGKLAGKHEGVEFYTIGQRHGLAIGGGLPYYVVGKNSKTNELIVALGENDPALLSYGLVTEKPTWTSGQAPKFPFEADVVIRYHHKPTRAIVDRKGNGLLVVFDKAEKAVTPGQFAVFYIRSAENLSIHTENGSRGIHTASAEFIKLRKTPSFQAGEVYQGDELIGSAVIKKPMESRLINDRRESQGLYLV